MRTLKSCLFLLSALLLVPLIYGQRVSTGDLHVTVFDPQGKPVAYAWVVARNRTNGIERIASGNGEGGYSLLALPPGTYVVTVNAREFVKATLLNVRITVGGSIELPVTLLQHMPLTSAADREIRTGIVGAPELVETTRTSTANTVDQRQIDDLPINGRNYINFTLIDSQVFRDNAPNTGAAPTSGLNISGQRARSNLINVDGADATDNGVNGVRSTVSQEDVQEFQVITNGYSPEYGRAAGGVVNIVTKSGSNGFHGDVFGYLRNRNFQAVNPFSTVSNPAYTRVQAGAAFGGAIKKDKTFFFLSYEVTRRHETGFSSIGQDCSTSGSSTCFGLVPFNTAMTAGGAVPLPFGIIQATPDQAHFLQGLTRSDVGAIGLTNLEDYEVLVGASSGQAIKGTWPTQMVQGATGGLLKSWSGFPTTCKPPGPCVPVPTSYQTLDSQIFPSRNFPVFEGTSLYSLRLDHNVSANNRLSLRANVSPSTITGIEVNGEDQPFGQNAYSRTSEQTYRDVAAVVADTWTISGEKLNQFMFQYARRVLSYFYNRAIPGGSYPAVNIPGFAYFGREPYSSLEHTEQRYQFTDNFSWTLGTHHTKFGADFNYIPGNASFTLDYGGVYDFGPISATSIGFQGNYPSLSAVQAYGAGIPIDFIQGLGNPSDSFPNIPIGVYWQDSWRVRRNLTLNYGLRYDVEIPPTFKVPTSLAAFGYKFLGLQKGIQTDTNNFQPRIGLAWDPRGDGKTAIRASYGIFYDHPMLGLYFLGNASDGSTSGQLAFGGTANCAGPGNPANLNAIPIFQGSLINPRSPQCAPSTAASTNAALRYLPDKEQFVNSPQSPFLNQNYLTATPLALGFQPFGLPQAKNFVYAYSQQVNFGIERDLGHGFALDLAYNFNGGRHLNRPINANPIRGDLMLNNLLVAQKAAQAAGIGPGNPNYPTSPFTVGSSTAFAPCGMVGNQAYVPASLMNFFRPSGLNLSIAESPISSGGSACVNLAEKILGSLGAQGFNAACDPASPTNCVPFGDMDANYSNGSSVYHGFSANLRKRFSGHYEFLASYTWSHAIDDSTDLQPALAPQDSYYPNLERSSSTFDQRHRFVFSGVYQSENVGHGFAGKLLSQWTFAPLIEFGSGRPFNIITGNGDNLQLSASSLIGRPNIFVNGACGSWVSSRFSPTGKLQEPCPADFNGSLLSLDGDLGRNAGVTPWTVFDDLRIARKIPFSDRISLDASVDFFNLANRYNVAAVSPLFTNPGRATAAYDPRQIQFGMKVNW